MINIQLIILTFDFPRLFSLIRRPQRHRCLPLFGVDDQNDSDDSLRCQSYDEYYDDDDDEDEADDFRSDEQRYEDAESERVIHEFFLDFEKARWAKMGKTKPDNFINPFEVYD